VTQKMRLFESRSQKGETLSKHIRDRRYSEHEMRFVTKRWIWSYTLRYRTVQP